MDMGDLDIVPALHQATLLGLPVEDHGSQCESAWNNDPPIAVIGIEN
jgi:hypothetical protein